MPIKPSHSIIFKKPITLTAIRVVSKIKLKKRSAVSEQNTLTGIKSKGLQKSVTIILLRTRQQRRMTSLKYRKPINIRILKSTTIMKTVCLWTKGKSRTVVNLKLPKRNLVAYFNLLLC